MDRIPRPHLSSYLVLFALLALISSTTAAQPAAEDDLFRDALPSGGEGPGMVIVPSGRFVLGGGPASDEEQGVISLESFSMSATEITAGQYLQFLRSARSGEIRRFQGKDEMLPVTGVSFDEAQAYVTWLSHSTGNSYRLPSASEWEYAARAASSKLYSWGDELGENRANCSNCRSEFGGSLAPVMSFPANDWGLYDMHGNAWEWTRDCVDANSAPPANGLPQLFGNCDLRELRGGSYESDGWSIRAGARAFGPRDMNAEDVGFRVVRDLDD
jgi:formylglycine-generating enzyme required for sulfatase activity